MEKDYKGQENRDYQFTRPENSGPDFGKFRGGNNLNGYDMAPMTMGEWIVTLIVMAIPCLNIIMCLVWGFGSTGNLNRRNFCRAYLIIMAALLVLYLVLALVTSMSLFQQISSGVSIQQY